MAKCKHYAPGGFFDRFRQACEDTGLSGIQLAEVCGLERKSLYNYIHGNITPPLLVCFEVSKRSGRSIDWMCTGTERKTMNIADETNEEKNRRIKREKTNAEIVQISKAGKMVGKSYGQMVAEAERKPWVTHKVINGKVVQW